MANLSPKSQVLSSPLAILDECFDGVPGLVDCAGEFLDVGFSVLRGLGEPHKQRARDRQGDAPWAAQGGEQSAADAFETGHNALRTTDSGAKRVYLRFCTAESCAPCLER